MAFGGYSNKYRFVFLNLPQSYSFLWDLLQRILGLLLITHEITYLFFNNFFIILYCFLCFSNKNIFAAVDHRRPVAKFSHIFHIVRDEQNRFFIRPTTIFLTAHRLFSFRHNLPRFQNLQLLQVRFSAQTHPSLSARLSFLVF